MSHRRKRVVQRLPGRLLTAGRTTYASLADEPKRPASYEVVAQLDRWGRLDGSAVLAIFTDDGDSGAVIGPGDPAELVAAAPNIHHGLQAAAIVNAMQRAADDDR